MRRAGMRDTHRSQAKRSPARIVPPRERTLSVRAHSRTANLLTGTSEGSASETSMRSGGVKSGANGTALVKRIVGMHINNLKEAI